ncbi:DUF4244 domain-containing protein [Antribacter sp. KLBMP9083]|uniref:DUF4244 domain-containing protein n=1 Tax=Antribacter soli TaxID=2910976 RepID=A0AA41QA00_9MICO|nr:DUF4244 domain-containing protein [Antribacter soli]MCF4119598.1 DUF4244 domain-containing protein [Antribacter soli]
MTTTITCPEPERGPAGPLRRPAPRDMLHGILRDVRRAASRRVPREVPGEAAGLARSAAAPVRRLDPEAGLATAEYALATVAAAGFAGLLIALLRSGEVQAMLAGIIRTALSVG